MSERSRARLAWALLALAVMFYAASLVLLALIPLEKVVRRSPTWPVDMTNLSLLAYAAIGALVAARRPRNAVGWIFLIMGLTWEIFALTNAYVAYAKLAAPELPVSTGALWLPAVMWMASFGLLPLLVLLFPGGSLPSPRWRPLLWLLGIGLPIALVSNGDSVGAGAFSFEIPALLVQLRLGFLQDTLQSFGGLAFLILMIGAILSMIVRLRRARGIERQQIKWFFFAGALFAVIILIESFFYDPLHALDPTSLDPADLFWGIPAALGFAILPIAAAVAILRHRLYEIDVIVRRTLIYGALTGLLALVYLASVLLLEGFFHLLGGSRQSPIVIILATLAISALFNPLRAQVQRFIDRRFFRRKYDAERVLERFSAAARNEVDLSRLTGELLNVVDETIQPEQVSLWMK